MRSSSKTGKSQPQTAKHNFQRGQMRYQLSSSSPYTSKKSFLIRENLQVHHSGPQFERQANLNLKNQRERKISALLEYQRLNQPKIKQQAGQHSDHSLGYIAQITAFERKKRARLNFLKKKEAFEENYKIGVLTKQGIEYQDSQDTKDYKGSKDSKEQQARQTQPPKPLSAQRQMAQEPKHSNAASQGSSVEQMHYELVMVQQKGKRMAKN